MKKEEFKNDIKLLKEKAPHVYNDVARVSNPLYRLHGELYSMDIEFLKKTHNLLMSELDIISSLFYSGGDDYILSPTQLKERLLFTSGGMTKVLKKLKSMDLISRIDNKDDARSKLVQLTKKGSDLAQVALKDILLLENEYFSVLNKKEQEELSKLLLKCIKR